MPPPAYDALMALSPIDYRPGADPRKLNRLRNVLANTPVRNGSPFESCRNVHMARFVIVDDLPIQLGRDDRDSLASKYLLFVAELDGGRQGDFLDDLYEKRRDFVEDVWGNCIGYPRRKGAVFFRRYIERCSIPANLPFTAYPGVTVEEIRSAIRLQARFARFVAENQNQPPRALRDNWRKFRAAAGIGSARDAQERIR